MNTPATNAAHACYLQWRRDNFETVPVLGAATVTPNADDRSRLDLRFADGSRLIVSLANDGLNLFWGEE